MGIGQQLVFLFKALITYDNCERQPLFVLIGTALAVSIVK